MGLIVVASETKHTASFFSLLAEVAAYSRMPWLIAIAIAAAAAIIAELLLKIRYSRTIGIILCIIGVLFLAYGVLLDYAKYQVAAANVPATTWVWVPLTGVSLIVAAWLLRRRRMRALHNRIKRLANTISDSIETLYQARRAPHYVEQLTPNGESIQTLLRSLVRRRSLIKRRKKERLAILLGLPGSGKTAALLRFAKDCELLRSPNTKPLIAIYIDLVEYATQIVENPSLSSFIQNRLVKNTASELDVEDAWNKSGPYVGWVFLFDNSDEADLLQGEKNWSSKVIQTLLARNSRLKSFYAVVALHAEPENLTGLTIELENLTDDGCRELLTDAGVDKVSTDALVANEGFYWYLRTPGILRFLALGLGRQQWTTVNTVDEALRDALDDVMQNRRTGQVTDQGSLQATATATIKYLMRTSNGCSPNLPTDISNGLNDIAAELNSSPQEVERNLTALSELGVVRWFPCQRDVKGIEFDRASSIYFCVHALLDSPGMMPLKELLNNHNYMLVAISLLQIADSQLVVRFTCEAESLLDAAITAIDPEEISNLRDRIQWAEEGSKVEAAKRAKREWDSRMTQALQTNNALAVLAAGVQNRPELLTGELRTKAANFTSMYMPLCDSHAQAHMLRVRYALGTLEQAVSTLEPGLSSQDSEVVLDTASRIANVLTETTELTDLYRAKLICLVIVTGLRSLNVNRERGSLPSALRLADGARSASIFLYGIFFGLGGLLQLVIYWRSPGWQICEVIIAAGVTIPLFAPRYIFRWRMFIVRHNFQHAMTIVTWFLAIVGISWAIIQLIYDLMIFSADIMSLLASYILLWPAFMIFYLTTDSSPTTASVIFPLPRVISTLWRTYVMERMKSLFLTSNSIVIRLVTVG